MMSTFRRGPPAAPSTWRTVLLVIGLIGFLTVTVVAYRNLPPAPGPVLVWPLAVVAGILVPGTILLNAMEYVLTARFLGHRVGSREALEVSVLTSAANLLPVPGSLLVRARGLRSHGATTIESTRTPILVGVLWAGVAAATAGVWLGVRMAHPIVVLGGIASLGIGVAALLTLVRRAPVRRPPVTFLFLVELGLVTVAAVRSILVLTAIGFPADIADGLALALSSVAATALGIIPGGLGIREFLSAAMVTLVDTPAAAGALVASIDRLLGLGVLGIVTILVLVVRDRAVADDIPQATGQGVPQAGGTTIPRGDPAEPTEQSPTDDTSSRRTAGRTNDK